MASNIELQLILGAKDNFSWRHCPNSSRPAQRELDIARADIDFIISQIADNPLVRRVSFGGSEPTLYLKEISRIQKSISRQIDYSLITNGWWGKTPGILDLINLNSTLISIDEYHHNYVDTDTILSAVNYLKARSVRTSINIVSNNTDEISKIRNLISPLGVECFLSQVEISGCAEALSQIHNNSRSSINNKSRCPSMYDELENEFLKATYVQGKGFSICCGDLIWKANTANGVWFEHLSKISESKLYQFHLSSAFSDMANLATSISEKTTCGKCFSIYSGSDDFYRKLNRGTDVVRSGALNALPYRSSISHIFLSMPQNKTCDNTAVGDEVETIAIEQADVEIQDAITNFIIDNYYVPFADKIVPGEFAAFDRDRYLYYRNYNFSLISKVGRKIVGVLTLGLFRNHPTHTQDVLHVGYWGYDHALITKKQAESMKIRWHSYLIELSERFHLPISVAIEDFNLPSIKLAEHFGIQRIGWRLNKYSGK